VSDSPQTSSRPGNPSAIAAVKRPASRRSGGTALAGVTTAVGCQGPGRACRGRDRPVLCGTPRRRVRTGKSARTTANWTVAAPTPPAPPSTNRVSPALTSSKRRPRSAVSPATGLGTWAGAARTAGRAGAQAWAPPTHAARCQRGHRRQHRSHICSSRLGRRPKWLSPLSRQAGPARRAPLSRR
jgi:hypothetical protein